MFKNVMAYRIGPNWNATVPEIETALSANRFTECTPGQDKSVGWTEPRNVSHGPLLESVGGQWIAKLLIETKVVPSSVVKRKADAGSTEGEDKFDADVVLSTGMLGPLLKDVIDALGGENVFAESASGEEGSPF